MSGRDLRGQSGGFAGLEQRLAGLGRPGELRWVGSAHLQELFDGNAGQLLRDPSRLLPGEKSGPKARVYAGMPVKAQVAQSLSEAL